MKYLNSFNIYKKLNENENANYSDFKMYINNNVLTVEAKGKKVDIKMDIPEIKFSKSFNQITKKFIDSLILVAKYTDIKHAFEKLGLMIIGYSGDNQPIQNYENGKHLPYFVVSTPKGYSGEVKNGGDHTSIGKNTSGGKIFTSKGDSVWSIFYLHQIQNTNSGEIIGMNNIKIVNKDDNNVTENVDVEIQEAFDNDKYDLTDNAKKEIDKLKNVSSVTILTGATQNGDVNEIIVKNGKKIKRGDWDAELVNKRYETIKKYLTSIGVKDIKISEKGIENGKYKVYGVYDKNDLVNVANRFLYIKQNKK